MERHHVDPHSSPLGLERTQILWADKSAATQCSVCSAAFGLITRKHHCRACGSVVCGSCSTGRWVLQGTSEAQRVCEACRSRHRIAARQRAAEQEDVTAADVNGRLRPPLPPRHVIDALSAGGERSRSNSLASIASAAAATPHDVPRSRVGSIASSNSSAPNSARRRGSDALLSATAYPAGGSQSVDDEEAANRAAVAESITALSHIRVAGRYNATLLVMRVEGVRAADSASASSLCMV